MPLGSTIPIGGHTIIPPGAANINIGAQQWGTFNTILVPYELAWKLPCDCRVKTGLAIGINDAMSSPGSDPSGLGPYAESGNGTWMFTPTVGISYLHAGWNLSAEFFYSFQTENTNTNYQSGDQFAADYTLTYTCGKWTFGAGAAQESQLFNDQINGVTQSGNYCPAVVCWSDRRLQFRPVQPYVDLQFPYFRHQRCWERHSQRSPRNSALEVGHDLN